MDMHLPAVADGARIVGSEKDKRGCNGPAGFPFLLCLGFWYALAGLYEEAAKCPFYLARVLTMRKMI
jgi:hypothetical protein